MGVLFSRRQLLALPLAGAFPALRQPLSPGYKLDLPPQSVAQTCILNFVLSDAAGNDVTLLNGPYSADFGIYSLHGLRLIRSEDMATQVDGENGIITVTIPKTTMQKFPIRFAPTAQYRLQITDCQSVSSPLFWGLFQVNA